MKMVFNLTCSSNLIVNVIFFWIASDCMLQCHRKLPPYWQFKLYRINTCDFVCIFMVQKLYREHRKSKTYFFQLLFTFSLATVFGIVFRNRCFGGKTTKSSFASYFICNFPMCVCALPRKWWAKKIELTAIHFYKNFFFLYEEKHSNKLRVKIAIIVQPERYVCAMTSFLLLLQ